MPQEHYKAIRVILGAIFFVSCSSNPSMTKENPPTPVLVETVKREDVPIYIETIGNVCSPLIVHLRPQVTGTLMKSYVQQGQIVKVGDLLYTIDPRTYQASVEKAKANLMKDKAALEFAKKRVKRFTDLVKKEFISKLTFDEYKKEVQVAEAQVLNDEAELSLAQIDLERCRIYSPIDGRISQFQIYPGNVVHPNDQNALTEIRQISPVCVHFSVPQSDLQQIRRYRCREDFTIEVILPHEKGEEFPDETYIGHVFFMDNHIDVGSGTILLKGEVENEEHLLWPGEFVLVRMLVREMQQALVVPEIAVQLGQNGPYLFVVQEDMIVNPLPIKLKEKVGDHYVVEGDIFEGDQIVTTGQLNLTKGKKVQIIHSSSKTTQ